MIVGDSLRELGFEVEYRIIKTEGDQSAQSLVRLGGIGVFAAALRVALLDNECDIAVHSFKDLPTASVPGLAIGAVPTGIDSHDVLCSVDNTPLLDLPSGATIGTGSPRRAAQIRRLRPDLHLVDIRGNVGTRLARVRGKAADIEGDLDGVVLARAGLARLGRIDAITENLDILPAPAQGKLAIECRVTDVPWSSSSPLAQALRKLNDIPSRLAAGAERAVLEGLQAGCAAPVGAKASNSTLDAAVFSTDGQQSVSVQIPLPPQELFYLETPALNNLSIDIIKLDEAARLCGLQAAQKLIDQGAGSITNLHATKERGTQPTHHSQALWRPGINGPSDDGADVSVHA